MVLAYILLVIIGLRKFNSMVVNAGDFLDERLAVVTFQR